MFHPLSALGLGILGATLCAAAAAQQISAPPAAPAPAYRSALEGYRPFADEGVAPWKDSNQAVREAGGWRAYAREGQAGGVAAQAPAAAASAAVPASAASAPAGHHKH